MTGTASPLPARSNSHAEFLSRGAAEIAEATQPFHLAFATNRRERSIRRTNQIAGHIHIADASPLDRHMGDQPYRILR